mgnify:CR=1 FL=1
MQKDLKKLENANNSIEIYTFLNKDFSGPKANFTILKNFILNGHLFKNCNFQNLTLIGVEFVNCEIIKCNFTQTDLINVKFKDCTLINCDFSNSKMQDVLIEGGIKTDCKFNNVKILDNVQGIADNVITENTDEQFIETIKQLDLHNILDYSDPTEIKLESNNIKLFITKEAEEYGDNIWRIMLFVNDEAIMSEEVDSAVSYDELKSVLTSVFVNTVKKLDLPPQEFARTLNTLDKIFEKFII